MNRLIDNDPTTRELRGQVGELKRQLGELARAEQRLLRAQDQRDSELRILKRLHELGQRIDGSFSLQTIMQLIPSFSTRELGYQRSLLFLDDRNTGTFTIRAFDGYASDELRQRLAGLGVDAGDPLPKLLRERHWLIHDANKPCVATQALAEPLALDRFLAFPLVGVTKNFVGFLIAGSNAADETLYTAVATDGLHMRGLEHLAEKASWAVNNCVLHWDLAVERNLLEAKVAERTAELSDAYARIEEDLEQARDFQQSILPPPPACRDLDIEVIYRPQGLVGGDLYDVEQCVDGRLQIFIADATGHGVTASLTTMFIKGEYDRIKRAAGGPAEVLRALNDELARTYGHLEMRFTALCASLDFARGELRYSAAAHPPPRLYTGSELLELEGGGSFMGLVAGVSFPEWTVPFVPGNGLYVFTDGLAEDWSPAGEPFGEERVNQAILAAVRAGRTVGQSVVSELAAFVGNGPRYDDITFVGVRWRQPDAAGEVG